MEQRRAILTISGKKEKEYEQPCRKQRGIKNSEFRIQNPEVRRESKSQIFR
jgi:hypothetical protein